MNEVKKFCADCKTTKTPLWRSGPHGPRSLCNACGIRYRKRKMADNKKQKTSPSSSRSDDYDDQMNEPLKMRYTYGDHLGNEMFVQRPSSSSSSPLKRHRSNSKEVEQAAVLLMSLSCGSVFA